MVLGAGYTETFASSDVIWNKFHVSHWNSFPPSFQLVDEIYFKWHLMSVQVSVQPTP